ncbi:MAG: M42 family metallopeptidase [Clostridiales bacterium]|nr:M42 family metallopeptidase [Clostridiales bacterium]
MIENIRELSLLNGASGHEGSVRDFIISKIQGKCEYKIDNLGNIIAFKKGKKSPKNKIMLDAHMDEVGVIITYITDDGLLKFGCAGGIDSKVILGRRFVFEGGAIGVAGVKPIHLLEKDERDKIPDADSLYIDIGVSSKAEAAKKVKIGEAGVFLSDFVEFGSGKIKGKALDDRIGCAVLIDLINSELEYDAYFSFSVQEEVGLRGAQTAAYGINPDYAVVLETTTAADIQDVPEHKRVCALGEGAAVSFMDRSTLYSPDLFSRVFKLAEEKNIKIQPKTAIAGGNNAGAIHKSREGVKTITVNVPCRYIHSPSCVCDTRDVESVRALAYALISELAND